MPRTANHTADIEALRKLPKLRRAPIAAHDVLTPRELIAYVMRNCGTTHDEIGKVLGVTRQMAEKISRRAEAKIGGDEK